MQWNGNQIDNTSTISIGENNVTTWQHQQQQQQHQQQQQLIFKEC
jgi:hypothetical protein